MPKVPYPYEVNDELATGIGSLIPICSLKSRSLLQSLTVLLNYLKCHCKKDLTSLCNTVSLVVQRSKSLTDQIPMGKLQLGKLQ